MVGSNSHKEKAYVDLRSQFVTLQNGVACCDRFQISTLMSQD
jgi:hypothetical protein